MPHPNHARFGEAAHVVAELKRPRVRPLPQLAFYISRTKFSVITEAAVYIYSESLYLNHTPILMTLLVSTIAATAVADRPENEPD